MSTKASKRGKSPQQLRWYRAIRVNGDRVLVMRCAPKVNTAGGLRYRVVNGAGIIYGDKFDDVRIAAAVAYLREHGIHSCHVERDGTIHVYASDTDYTVHWGDVKGMLRSW